MPRVLSEPHLATRSEALTLYIIPRTGSAVLRSVISAALDLPRSTGILSSGIILHRARFPRSFVHHLQLLQM
jgi:hypothetical protein